MVRELKSIDVSNSPELIRVAEEVRDSREPCVLRRDSEDLAILIPAGSVSKTRRRRVNSRAAYEAFRAAAGGWKDVDTDRLIADIYADRRRSDRPPVTI